MHASAEQGGRSRTAVDTICSENGQWGNSGRHEYRRDPLTGAVQRPQVPNRSVSSQVRQKNIKVVHVKTIGGIRAENKEPSVDGLPAIIQRRNQQDIYYNNSLRPRLKRKHFEQGAREISPPIKKALVSLVNHQKTPLKDRQNNVDAAVNTTNYENLDYTSLERLAVAVDDLFHRFYSKCS